MSRKMIVLAANTVWYLANFRLNLARELRNAGFEVVAIAPYGEDAARIEAAGIRFIPVPMDNMGTNVLRDFVLLLRLLHVLRRERPAAFLGYTVKPNVFGGIACRILRIPSVHNIAGLGTAFIEESWLTGIVRALYRSGLKAAATVFFQNPDDLDLFLRQGLVRADQAKRVPGSGVDTDWFRPQGQVAGDMAKPFRFLLSARLLWDKGIGEYAQAARQLVAEGRSVECQLLGFLGAENRTAIPRETIEAWEREGIVRYLGHVRDVRGAIAQADCVVLPSYREGTPRSLLEAASMGKPIVTANSVGCRETVEDGVTGLLCQPRDAADLASQMSRMMDCSPQERAEMGRRARAKMVREFDERIVIASYLQVVEEIVASHNRRSAAVPTT